MYEQTMARLGWGLIIFLLGFAFAAAVTGLMSSGFMSGERMKQPNVSSASVSKTPDHTFCYETDQYIPEPGKESKADKEMVCYGKGYFGPPQPRLTDPSIPRDGLQYHEITAKQLAWFSTDEKLFPVEAMKLVDAWMQNDYVNDYVNGSFYTLFDLDGDHQSEIIVRSNENGSGGTPYLILKKRNGKWVKIGGFTGGFILMLDEFNPEPEYEIIVYYRSGDTYQNVYRLQKGKYKVQNIKTLKMPDAIVNNPQWRKFWLELNGVMARSD